MLAKNTPLQQLKQYTGNTPRSRDFWGFWKKRAGEAWALPLEYELKEAEIPHTPYTQYYDVWLRGAAGARLHAKYVKPVRKRRVPVILQFHGYPGSSRGWFEQPSLAGLGMAILAVDCPGQGDTSEDLGGRQGITAADHIIMGVNGPPEKLYYAGVLQDTCLMICLALALEELDTEQIYVNGASQGAGLRLVCTALNAAYIKRCAALYPFLSDYRRIWEMGRDVIVYNGLTCHTRWFDPMGEHLDEFFTKSGHIDIQSFIERATCPVLCGTGFMGDICLPSTQFVVFSRITARKKHLIFYEYGYEEIAAFDNKIINSLGNREDGTCLEQI